MIGRGTLVCKPQFKNPRCFIGIGLVADNPNLAGTAAHWDLFKDGLLLIVPRIRRGSLGVDLLLDRDGVRAVWLLWLPLVDGHGRQRGRHLAVERKI